MDKIQFIVKGQKHIIGSKLFPVSSKSKIVMFTTESTQELDRNDFKILQFAKLIDQCSFEMGRCYSSSDIVFQIAKHLDLEVEYFSGWMVYLNSNTTFPTHHAWVVINKTSIVDLMWNKEEIKVMKAIDQSLPNFREKLANQIAEIRKKKLPLSEYCIFGKLFDFAYYVGSPDTKENARRIFRNLIVNYPNHPSYDDENPYGRTELQKLIKERME